VKEWDNQKITIHTEDLGAQNDRLKSKIEPRRREKYCAERWARDKGRTGKRISNTEKNIEQRKRVFAETENLQRYGESQFKNCEDGSMLKINY
jgi:hypothetical protein